MVAVSTSAVAKGAVVAGATQAACLTKGIGMSMLLGAGAWGGVLFAVIATAATYDFLTKPRKSDGKNPAVKKSSTRSVLATVKAAISVG